MDTLELKSTRRSDYQSTLRERSVVIPLSSIEKIMDNTEQLLSIHDPYIRFFTIMRLIGLNFEELASRIGYSESSVRNWYYGYNKISSRNLIHITHHLGLPIELFVNGIDLGQGPTTLLNPFNMASTEYILGYRVFRERIAILKEYTHVGSTEIRNAKFDPWYLSKQSYIYKIPPLESLVLLSKLFNVPMSFLIKGVELRMPLDF